VQVSKANFIHSWLQVPQMQIQRLGEGLWQSKAIDLEREADYHVLPSAEQISRHFLGFKMVSDLGLSRV
jgi:hypothetical protein